MEFFLLIFLRNFRQKSYSFSIFEVRSGFDTFGLLEFTLLKLSKISLIPFKTFISKSPYSFVIRSSFISLYDSYNYKYNLLSTKALIYNLYKIYIIIILNLTLNMYSRERFIGHISSGIYFFNLLSFMK